MNVDGFFHDLPELETGRLLLRKLRMTDAQDMYEYSRDPEVARHVLWDAHQSVGDSRGYLRYAVRQYRQDLPASWGIELKENHKLIGTIGFMWINRDHNSAEVGYSLAREYWQFFSIPGRKDCIAFNCPEFFDIHDADDGDSLTEVQLQGKQAILRQLLFYRRHFGGFEGAYIASVAQFVGVRESRRAVTEHVITAEELLTHTKFDDAICQSNYPVDVHGRKLRCETIRPAAPDEPPFYEGPLRALIVRDVDNLLVAGRNLGAEFVAQSSIRIIPTCRAMGEAAGIAAAFACGRSDKNAHSISGRDVRAEMLRRGAQFADRPGLK